MSKKRIHFLFSIIFVVFITAPSVVPLIDDNCDISHICGLDDEKEKEEKEGQKTFEINFLDANANNNTPLVFDYKLDANFYLNTFKELHMEHVSPPPELM